MCLFESRVNAKQHEHLNSAAMSSSRTALQSFSLANNVSSLSPQDEIYRFDAEANKRINRDAPWAKESVSFSDFMLSGSNPLLKGRITSSHAKSLLLH
jgi:hypothetical protein